LCLFQTKTWISNFICRGLYFEFSELTWEVIVPFVDISGVELR
jgi:hypothetical protein